MTDRSQRLLFLMRNLYYLRNFEAPLRALATRDFRITVLSDPGKDLSAEVLEQVAQLKRDFPQQIEFAKVRRRGDLWRYFSDEIRCARDLLRYHGEAFAAVAPLKRRAQLKSAPIARLLFAGSQYADARKRARAEAWLKQLGNYVPLDSAILSTIARIDPGLIVVTPLIDFRTAQHDWVRAARHLGIPTVLAVASWDNLTNKGRIQAMPDRVIVWNRTQQREAVELHGVPEDRIVVTGAQLYDHWFERQPSRDRPTFCRELGLDPARPLILYVGSSTSIAGNEVPFVRRWLEAIRSTEFASLRQANVLVRPHPLNQQVYRDLMVDGLAPAVVHPRVGGLPVVERARAEYFDALFHCNAIVGLNTSALVEASILGKRCFTLRDPAGTAGQEGTLHFRHLTGGGILHYAPTLQEHLHRLATEIENSGTGDDDIRAFVRDFLRPGGTSVPATPLFVQAIVESFSVPCEGVPVERPSARLKAALHLAKIGAAVVGLGERSVLWLHRLWTRARRRAAVLRP